MRSACFIPIKANSERIKEKNLRLLNGKKLYTYVFDNIEKADVFDDIFVDTNSKEVAQNAKERGFHVIERIPELALNSANGNDLLVHHFLTNPGYDYYYQMFATAPYLQSETIRACYEELENSTDNDSVCTVTENHSFYWYAGSPINYRPCILPRSQDMQPVVEETTGLYGITAVALDKYRCRIGAKPILKVVSKFEAVDINTEEDLRVAEFVGKAIYGYGTDDLGSICCEEKK